MHDTLIVYESQTSEDVFEDGRDILWLHLFGGDGFT
jgi:hypothetical protein